MRGQHLTHFMTDSNGGEMLYLNLLHGVLGAGVVALGVVVLLGCLRVRPGALLDQLGLGSADDTAPDMAQNNWAL